MPTPTLTPGDHQEDKLNPGQQGYERRVDNLSDIENRGTADNKVSKDTDSIQESESNPSNPQKSWNTNVTPTMGGGKSKVKVSNLKKAGPIGLVLSLLGVGGIGFAIIFTPSMLLVHMKETLTDKFNDQLAVLDVRTTKIMTKKVGDSLISGTCTSVVNIRCRYQTMSKRQINKLKQAGIEAVDKDGKILTSRGRAAGLRLTGTEEVFTADKIQGELRSNTRLKAGLNKFYNPRVTAFSDSIAKRVNAKLKITKKNNMEGATSQTESNKKLRSNVSGDGVELDTRGRITTTEADDGTTSRVDGTKANGGTGNVLSDADMDNLAKVDAEKAAKEALSNTGQTVGRTAIKGGLTVTAMGLGAVDSLCTGYRTIRAVGFAAKYIGMLQLSRYAYTFMNTADAIKTGDATPEQVEYLSNILTKTNSEGKSATDSYGYKYAAYNDVGGLPSTNTSSSAEQANLNDEVLRYVNGQPVSGNVLSQILSLISTAGTTAGADDVCGFVKSGWGQGILIGTAVAGGLVAIFTGGISVGWGTAAQVGGSLAIGLAVSILTPKLADMVAGTLVNGDENGNEAGNAIVSGMGGYNAQVSQARGLGALTKEDAVAYQNLTNETIALYNEVDKVDANPFDITNRNTFIGSFVSKLTPYVYGGSNSKVVASIFSSFGAAASSLSSAFVSKAASIDEFSQCNDPEYIDMDLATDPFCNVKYGIDVEAAKSIDPDTVLDYMLDGGYINEETGQPVSGAFTKFIETCVDRTDSLGAYSDEDMNTDEAKGYDCIEGHGDNADRNTMFRLYLIDNSIVSEMDGDMASATTASASTSTSTSTGSEAGEVSSGRPDNAKDQGQGWSLQSGVDYSSAACAPGTVDEGVYTHPIEKFTFRKCRYLNVIVNSLVSQSVVSMIETAKSQGVTLALGNSFRSYEEQQKTYAANCPNGNCKVPTAKPGNSQHERGLAIDFTSCSASSACFKWLKLNAVNYGYYNLPSESWHWSQSGY